MQTAWTSVEKSFLAKSGRKDAYKGEQIATVEVQNVYELGQLVAIAFLEWVTSNPSGVVALPTGRTPEYFIKTMDRYRASWGDAKVVSELKDLGFTPGAEFPDTTKLTFVMLDEFFPMSTAHRNSFCNYIRNFYVGPLKVAPENVLDFDLVAKGVITDEEMSVFAEVDVDLSLLTRDATSVEEKTRKGILMKVQQYCDVFEDKIRSLGGIGFFLGGIGPDGHVAFNQEHGPLDSRTRLVNFNYPTAAAAAGDLGGIDKARGKAAMTIGLSTITSSPTCRAIVMAAGEGKAEVVRSALEDPKDPSRPASSLHGVPGARFYLTHGAAGKLSARKAEDAANISVECVTWALAHLSGVGVGLGIDQAHLVVPPAEYLLAESLIYAAAKKLGKPVHKMSNASDLKCLPQGDVLPSWISDDNNFRVLVSCAARRLREKIDGGLRAASCVSKSILHTGPHHDDIMLSYHGAMHEMLGRQPAGMVTNSYAESVFSVNKSGGSNPDFTAKDKNGNYISPARRNRSDSIGLVAPLQLGEKYNGNVNHFAYLTSGFHSVEDRVLTRLAASVMKTYPGTTNESYLAHLVHAGELNRDYDELMAVFRDAFLNKDQEGQDYVEMIIFLRTVCYVWNIVLTQTYSQLEAQVYERVQYLLNEYLSNHQPGDAVPLEMQLLKGCMRESEVDRVWALSKMPMNRIHHMRSKFYTDDFFCPMPSLEDDAMPVANLLRARQPELLTVAFDPEGTGPDTHYKVLQVIAAGLKMAIGREDLKNPNPMIWGYRNVWFVFAPWEATLMIPCSEEDLQLMHDTFMSCFTTQKEASFPSPHYDGPFSAWSRHLQIEQKQQLVELLGEEYFSQHKDERVRNCHGFIFLRAMHAQTFLDECEGLKSKFENV
jgi:6-phosphogluconolactonase/glucosamine-6-phosphate isomerase/deaminase